ncbi:MAG: SbcC/MukB-like Walker B domain-containing protein [Mongoliitalea sp.]
MIPLKLEIEGLYSYKEKQVIDFTQLTAAGLFGIFGAVGSGKSSILEAILLALYGSTERLSDRGEKNSMLNLQSEALKIVFEFRSGKNNTHTYRSIYLAKRNPKKFEEVKPAEHNFYKLGPSDWEPIEQSAEQLLGMKKEHFKQTVIIPQGKFREFIDLTPGPRADMMKELFGLERFDLSAKTGTILRQVKDEKIRLETQLVSLDTVSKEALESKKSQIQELAATVERNQAAFSEQERILKTQEGLLKKHLELQEFLQEWNSLEEKKPSIQEKKRVWKEFLTAKTYLKPVWQQMQEKQLDLEKEIVSAENCRRFQGQYIQDIKTYQEELKALRKKADLKSERESKIRDLKKVIEIQGIQQDFEQAKDLTEKLAPAITQEKKTLKELSDRIQSLEARAEAITTVDNNTLADRKMNVQNLRRLEEQIRTSTKEKEHLDQLIDEINGTLHSLNKQLPQEVADFSSWMESQQGRIRELEGQKEKHIQKAGLATHIHLLHEGEACPLCGALEHPNPLEAESVEAMQSITDSIEDAKNTLEKIRTLQNETKQESFRLEAQLGIRKKLQETIQSLQEEQKTILAHLRMQGIENMQALETSIKEAEERSSVKASLEKEVKHFRKEWNDLQAKLETEEQKLREAEQQQLALQSRLSSKREEIKDINFCKPFFEKDTQSIESSIEKVQRDIDETAFKLEGKQKALQETQTKQATNLANLEHAESLIKILTIKIQELEQEFNELMRVHGFMDESEVIALFNHSLDADKVDAEIRLFEDRCLLVNSKIQELRAEEGVEGFSQHYFDQLTQEVAAQKSALEALQKEFTLLDKEISTLSQQLEQKNTLLQEFSHVENRETNLKELEKLFKGSGFVKYVSTIYLKELCNTANIRFMKLTKNSLSLDMDDNNTFWVIDYLNGGKRRLLKTLSGGQTFQASLCLALALAEKVKALNQADQSFFFLDEGFGALDKNSLRVVFETLKSLRHENRIVGIISHVEELQQEIGVYAKVELDAERGSVVGYSY